MNKFSFYKAPIRNTHPAKSIGLEELYDLVRGDRYKEITELLRTAHKGEYRQFKASKLDNVTVGGIFSKRGDKYLKKPSGYMVLDLDHMRGVEYWKEKIANEQDHPFVVKMIFISPSGDGLKVVIEPSATEVYSEAYEDVRAYFWKRYALKLNATQDISRACFLCHDPMAKNYSTTIEEAEAQMIKSNPLFAVLKERLGLETIGVTNEHIKQ